jgi:hypothetical protein
MACLGLILASAAHAVHYTATLTGGQEVPPNGSTATGTCSLDQIANYLIGSCEHTVASPIAAHIHNAPPGVAGGIVFPFSNPASPINVNWTGMSSGDMAALAAGNLYVNIHTGAFPDGEIRGQIVLDEEEPPPPPDCTDDADTACLQSGRFKVEVTWAAQGQIPPTGTGKVMSFGGMRAQNNDSVFIWFFGATNFEMGLKILNACGLNQKYWVFISGLTNVEWHVTITDTVTGAVKEYDNPPNHLTETTADTDALDCS